MNGPADSRIRAATAEHRAHGLRRYLRRWAWDFVQQKRGRNHLARLAKTALRRLLFKPGLFHPFGQGAGQTFDGGHLLPGHIPQRHLTGQLGLTVESRPCRLRIRRFRSYIWSPSNPNGPAAPIAAVYFIHGQIMVLAVNRYQGHDPSLSFLLFEKIKKMRHCFFRADKWKMVN